MEFQHEQSWNYLTTLLASKMSAKDAWNKFIDFHEKIVSNSYWKQLRQLDIETEQAEIVAWLEQLVKDEPMPDTMIAIWIGIFKYDDNGKETPTIYFAGADNYDKEDIDWASDPAYLPEKAYVQPEILQQIDDIIKKDKENYEFLDRILPVAYCALTFDEIIRVKLDKKLIVKNNKQIPVAVGHDSGDYVDLSALT